MELTNIQKWLLFVIDSVPYVQGKTRLQKYALFAAREILKENEFYNDWEPLKFGGYSKNLDSDFEILCKDRYVNSNQIGTYKGKPVFRYRVSDSGKKEIIQFEKNNAEKILEIHSLIHYYFSKPLNEVLVDSYEKYPDLIGKSTIIPEVNRTKIQLDSFLSSKYEIPIDQLDFSNENFLPKEIPINEHIFNDEEIREKLAKKIGLDKPPKLDPDSFERLAGIFESEIKSEKVDSVEVVRTVRGS